MRTSRDGQRKSRRRGETRKNSIGNWSMASRNSLTSMTQKTTMMMVTSTDLKMRQKMMRALNGKTAAGLG